MADKRFKRWPSDSNPARPTTGARPSARADRSASRALTLAAVAREARLDVDFLLLMALSAAIATLGLLQDSTAVVIGAMLVSPLMGPIMALGFGLAVFESALLRRGAVTLVVGVGVGILVAAIIVYLSPIKTVTPELAARTSPTLLDLGVALVGGLAGAHSVIRRRAAVMVGVAIATALVPPLATAAFGLVTGRWEFVSGALLLFFTNTAAIVGTAALVARFNRFRANLSPQQTGLQTVAILGSLALVAVPLAGSLRSIIAQAQVQRTSETLLTERLPPSARVTSMKIDFSRPSPSIEAVVIVDAYLPGLEAAYRQALSRALPGRPMEVTVLQLAQTTEASVAARQKDNSQIAAWSQERSREREVAGALDALRGVDATSVLVDGRRRKAFARMADPSTPDTAAALGALRARFPDWTIEVEPVPAEPPNDRS